MTGLKTETARHGLRCLETPCPGCTKEIIATTLRGHRWLNPRDYGYGPSACDGCDWTGDWKDSGVEHEAHLADRIAAALRHSPVVRGEGGA